MAGKNGTTTKKKPADLSVQRAFELYWIDRLEKSRADGKPLEPSELKLLLQAFDQNCFGDPESLDIDTDDDGAVAGKIESSWVA